MITLMSTLTARNITERRRICRSLTRSFPNKIPIIIEKIRGTEEDRLRNKKYLVSGDMEYSTLLRVIGKRMQLSANQSIFISFNEVIPTGKKFSQIHACYAHSDGFLYGTICLENTYG